MTKKKNPIDMTPAERLSEMYRLNYQTIPGYGNPPKSKRVQVYVARPGESVNEFYRRIDGEEE